jgi:NAD(P)-dependent dehydrogenase (short-subunit alcohol dehydrogenase family)
MYMQESVLITGCSSGIGIATAHYLRTGGFRVFTTARRQADLAALESAGFECFALELRDPASIGRCVEAVLSACDGRLYGLFNNAGFGQPGAVEDLSRDALRLQFETNLFGTHELTCHILPAMRRAGRGRIIQNSSVLGLVALRYRGAYNASKHALEGLSDTLRQELQGSGVHVSLIEPGPVSSRFRANSHQAYQVAIRPETSAHRACYAAMERRFTREGPVAPFTLPPEAVARRVLDALTQRRPKPRYYVTKPTYLFGTLKRLCSTRMLDRILLRVSEAELK